MKTKENEGVKKVEKELIANLNERVTFAAVSNRKINRIPFWGMLGGFIFGVAFLVFNWNSVSGIVPQSTYRFAALGILGFPIVLSLMGILAGRVVEWLLSRLTKQALTNNKI